MKRRTGVQSASAFLLASAFAIGALPALAHDEGERDRWSYEDKTARGSSVRGQPAHEHESYRTNETRSERGDRRDDDDREQLRGTGGGTGAGMGDESSSGNEGSRDMR